MIEENLYYFLRALCDRLKAERKMIFAAAAAAKAMPTDKALSRLADLEAAIGAVEAMLEEASTER